MKTCSLPVVVILLTLLACAACGSRPPSDAATAVMAMSDESTSARPESLNAPASARPVSSATVTSGADGVNMRRWAELKRAERARRRPDPVARSQAEEDNQARASTLALHERDALEALEEALVEELNRMRGDPVAYSALLSEFRTLYRGQRVVVPGHMTVRTREGVVAVDDAIAVAASTAPMAALVRSDGLTRAARAYAFRLGQERSLGRDDDDSINLHRRMDAYGRVSGMYAENVGAVYRDPRLMLLALFVDDSVDTRVHRYNMIGPMFRLIGVGCAPHPTYQVICVMNLAESYREAPAPAE